MTSPTIDSTSPSLSDLQQTFLTATEKTQLQMISQFITTPDTGFAILREYLLSQKEKPASIVTGKAFLTLYHHPTPENQSFLGEHFPQGIVSLRSDRGIDYQPLQDLLIEQDFQEADRISNLKLCELAGETALTRQWLYFTEVNRFPVIDLQTVDRLWRIYSEGKFGFSVQRKIWLSTGQDFNKLWEKINWKKGNTWTRYPHEFTWNMTAPVGHLPLSNQLRGVRVIDALFAHPVWTQDDL